MACMVALPQNTLVLAIARWDCVTEPYVALIGLDRS